MKLQNAIKKISKIVADIQIDIERGKVTADYKGARITITSQKSWNGEGREVVGVHTHGVNSIEQGDVKNAHVDYFPGSYHNNLTSCIKHIDQYTSKYGAY